MASRPAKWRILAVTNGVELPTSGEATPSRLGPLQEFADLAASEAEVELLTTSSAEELGAKVAAWKPNLLYIATGTVPDLSLPTGARTLSELSAGWSQGAPLDAATLAKFIAGQDMDAVFLQSFASRAHADALREQGVAHVVYYEAGRARLPNAQHVTHFSHAFFATLRNKSATVPEAFAMAMHSCHAHCGPVHALQQHPSWLPELVSDFDPLLPSIDSVPLPVIEGRDFKTGVARAVPGWGDVRLLAPHAELRLLACGQSALIDAQRLSYLGEALRALLVLEVRQLRLAGRHPCERTPAHLPEGATASRCSVRTASGAHATVVLGGPPNVLGEDSLVEYALRQTLVADAVSLQFRLPPPGVPPPVSRRSPAIAHNTPVVDTLVITSVWAVHLLRTLSQEKSYRTLVALGIGAVGGSAVSAFNQADAARLSALTAGENPKSATLSVQQANGVHPPATPGSNPSTVPSEPREEQPVAAQQNGHSKADKPPAPAGGARAAEALKPGQKRKLEQSSESWSSKRPRMQDCSEEAFLQDLCAFHRNRGIKNVSPDNFPDAILNGSRLDVYHLYREVTTRGGFRVGNGINWKGQIFPKLNNYTAHNRMTGVGNALKRHYTLYLLEYELAHPEDVIREHCALCNRGDDHAHDWVCCDSCNTWVHFSCDDRTHLGTFKDYSKGNGATYTCVQCAPQKA